MANVKSKYVDFGTMSFAEFSKSKVGTVAKYVLTTDLRARNEVSKSLKSACHKSATNCQINTTDIMVKVDDSTWKQAHILEAVIV